MKRWNKEEVGKKRKRKDYMDQKRDQKDSKKFTETVKEWKELVIFRGWSKKIHYFVE